MDFDIPQALQDYLDELDRFIEAEIKPLEQEDDNIRFFDHRREHARTDWDNNGLPRKDWEQLLRKARERADKAGHLRYAWPRTWAARAAPASTWR
jgi:acyl-CoA dehydrogenase